ncbi:MAG: hypothetical protein DID89_2727547580 [Candidatus Nitrotoga sp. CP45]|nr:MAG: hypothetical protein DID89_2727547580 [Candidatus Nitrotoga sp. CP45]
MIFIRSSLHCISRLLNPPPVLVVGKIAPLKCGDITMRGVDVQPMNLSVTFNLKSVFQGGIRCERFARWWMFPLLGWTSYFQRCTRIQGAPQLHRNDCFARRRYKYCTRHVRNDSCWSRSTLTCCFALVCWFEIGRGGMGLRPCFVITVTGC